ncbi:type I-E CRISPR-associated protein Cse2/CasB [Gulosibacter sp. GYB002]|uniref:type I-E CRISPR-associated protein Cse2/CasB n=1 Tax=Gulosibacter sp. GYB002 TaxID=2994391 RepID=UPI002F968FBE
MNTVGPAETQRKTISGVVGGALSRLQHDYLSSDNHAAQAQARGILATLRRGAGTAPEQDLVTWQQTLELVVPDLPEQFQGKSNAPSPSERAIYDALTLYALHMQSQQKPMHDRSRSFARAAGVLVAKRDSDSVKPRFDALLMVKNPSTRRHHARGLITLMRAESIGFDYGRFAEDLYRLDSPSRNSVLLAWGRDFANGRFRQDQSTVNDSAQTTN